MKQKDIANSNFLLKIKNKEILLKSVPLDERTPEICLEAMLATKIPFQFEHVPAESRTDKVLIEAASQNIDLFFYFCTPDILTESLCIAIVKKNPNSVFGMPDRLTTQSVWTEVVHQDWRMLKDVPIELCSEKMCIDAIQQNSKAFEHIPENFRKREIYLAMLQNDARAIRFIPDIDKAEIIKIAVNLPINSAIILNKFNKLGVIQEDEIALILAAKMRLKKRKNSIFIIHADDIIKFQKNIKRLLVDKHYDNPIKFQFIYCDPVHSHYVFGQIAIDRNCNPPSLKYFHCDPAVYVTESNKILTDEFLKEISQSAKIEIYESNVYIQKGIGCSYFSIDGCLMLATPSTNSYVQDAYQFMESNYTSKEIKNNILHIWAPIPIRLARGAQYYEDERIISSFKITGLKTYLSSDKMTLVNKNGENAEDSINRDLITQEKNKIFNMRIHRKRESFKKDVRVFLDFQYKPFTTSEYWHVINQYKISGFKVYCNAILSFKPPVMPKKIKHESEFLLNKNEFGKKPALVPRKSVTLANNIFVTQKNEDVSEPIDSPVSQYKPK